MKTPLQGIGALREYFYGEDIGQAQIEPKDPIVVGRMGKWRITYKVGACGVSRGGGLRFTPPNGFSTPQFEEMTEPGYCKFRCLNENVSLVPSLIEPVLGYTFLPASLGLQVQGSSLAAGDVIEIDYGWTPSGIPGVQAQALAMPVEFTLSIDSFGEGNWELLPDTPTFDVIPEEPSFLWVTAPAQVVAGQQFSVRAVVRDCFHNVATTGESIPSLVLPDEKSVSFRRESPGILFAKTWCSIRRVFIGSRSWRRVCRPLIRNRSGCWIKPRNAGFFSETRIV